MVLAYVVGLIPALLMALTQPVWSREDEAQHTDFIIQLSHGVYPLADRTLIDPETLRLTESTGVYRFEGPGSYPVPDISDIGPPPSGMSPRANAVWMSRHLWQLSYESVQTPGYYVLMVPLWVISDRLLGTLGSVYVLRVVNALLIALLAPMAVVVALQIAPNRPAVAAAAAIFAALLPGLDLNVTRVGNDALAAVIGGLTVVLATRWTGGGWTLFRALVLGGLLGAAVLVKLTLLGLAPAVAVAVLWPATRVSLSRRIALLVVAGLITCVAISIWFAVNVHLYGVPLPSARTNRLSVVAPLPFDYRFIPFEFAFFLVSYWSGEPLGTLPFAAGFVALGVVLSVIAAIGLARWRTSRGLILVGLAAIAGMAAVSLVLPALAAFQFAGPGRYEYPALPAAAALLALGLFAALARPFAWRTLTGMYGAGAAVLLLGGALGVGVDSTPSGTGSPPASAVLTNTTGAGALGGVRITVDQVAIDPIGQATWLHVTVSNGGEDEVEWMPVPTVHVGSEMSTAEYAMSTHLPGDLEPGQSVTGWLYLPMDVRAGQTLRIVFPGVAADQYRTVADVTVEVRL